MPLPLSAVSVEILSSLRGWIMGTGDLSSDGLKERGSLFLTLCDLYSLPANRMLISSWAKLRSHAVSSTARQCLAPWCGREG